MTPHEINEQVALRLGWKEIHYPDENPKHGYLVGQPGPPPYYKFPEKVPNWAEDDGLAFKELWLRIDEMCEGDVEIRRCASDDPAVTVLYPKIKLFTDSTWALAICKAFIELVPLSAE